MTAFRKVWRDLWNNKGRTLIVVCSIGVGVLALGMITASNALVSRQMSNSQRASHPAHVVLFLTSLVNDDQIRSIARLPDVTDAQGVTGMNVRWKATLDGEWKNANVIAVDDYENQQFNLIELKSGAFPSSEAVAVEFNHIAPYNVPQAGGTIYIEVNNRAKPIAIGGTVRDPGNFPPPFTQNPTFYATRDMLVQLGGQRDYFRVLFSIPDYSKERAEAVASSVEARLKKTGIGVSNFGIQDPERHFLQDIFDGVGLILNVMAILSLGLSVFLVVNTINAIIAQQVPQIGIMKTIGGLSPEISSIYLSGVVVYGLLSLLLAVPIGAWGGVALSQWMLAFINVPASNFEILSISLGLQIVAGLMAPIGAALWPILQGVGISVREALNAYGLGTGHYGSRGIDRLLGQVRGIPRMAALALRNTFRRTGRVALTETTLILAGAIFMMVISTSYSFSQTIDDIWKGFGFDVLIGFEQFQRIDKVVPLIQSRPNVEYAEMWIWRSDKISQPGSDDSVKKEEVFLRGIPGDSRMFSPKLTAGRNLDPTDGRALLLNQKLATDMGFKLGDQVALDLGQSRASLWTIVGLVNDITAQQKTAYLNRDVLAAELNTLGRATIAEIRTSASTSAAKASVEKDLDQYFETLGINLSFTTNSSKDREEAEAQFSILTTLLLVMTFLIAVVGSMGLSGTLSINVLERRREIGVMRAVGASSVDVALIFMGEGLLLGLLSWIVAVPFSLITGQWFVAAIGAVVNFPVTYYYSINGIFTWLGIVVVLSLVASWLPARRATQISVRESLAYE